MHIAVIAMIAQMHNIVHQTLYLTNETLPLNSLIVGHYLELI